MIYFYIDSLPLLLIASYLRTFVPSYLRTFVPSYLRTFVPSYLRTFVPSYLRTFVPSYLRTFVPSYLRTFVPSYLRTFRTFVPSYLRTFYLRNKYPKYLRKNNIFVFINIKFSKGRIVCVIVCVVYAYILYIHTVCVYRPH